MVSGVACVGCGLAAGGWGGRGGARAELHFARRTEIDGISAYGNNDPRGHKKIRLSSSFP